MTTPLLQTKLYIPQLRPEIVRRPHLLERLNEGLGQEQGFSRKLCLISAPAGFGKTTLVSEWLRQLDISAAWISLDENDNNLVRFLSYVTAALQTIETRQTAAGNIGQDVLRMLQSPQPPPIETVLTVLINELAASPDQMILALDDYHLIDASPIHEALTFLLEHLPPHVHLVILTREDPLLPLARLRAQGQLTELRAADLRFSISETAEFLNQMMGLNLTEKEIAALEIRTEGWIAGLQLAAISMQRYQDQASFIRSFTGSHHFILDYLIEEVLEQQPEQIQTFLLQTALLDRLNGSLCDALTGQDNSQATLEMLEHANLFIVPLDDERRWYRYHHLFADLLRQRLYQTRPKQLPVLYSKASEWYEAYGFNDEAIDYALCAGDFERSANLISEQADTIWALGEHSKLLRWLAELPEEWLFSKLQLCIYHAWFLFSTGQEAAAKGILEAIDRSLAPSSDCTTETPAQEPGPLSASAQTKLQGRLGAMRATMEIWWKDVSGVIEHASQALEYLSKDDPWRGMAAVALGDAYYFRGDVVASYQARLEFVASCKPADDLFLFMIAHLKVATSLRELGQLQQTIEICQQQVAFAQKNRLSQTIFAGWAMGLWGITLAERNQLDQALELATRSVELTRGGDLAFFGFCSLVLAKVLFYRGDLEGAESVLQELEHTAQNQYLPLHITEPLAAWKARLWLARGQLETALQWRQARGLDADVELKALLDDVVMVLGRILIAQGKLDEAARLLDRLLGAAELGKHTARTIEILILQTLAFQAKNNTAQAIHALERAIVLAEPGGYIRVFADEGPPMARLLYKILEKGLASDYVRQLLAAFALAEPEQPLPLATQTANVDLIEPLSERELEVLQFIAKGLTNREIADRLFLTLNTVKVHARNIYGKLDAHNRIQAVAKARALGILSLN